MKQLLSIIIIIFLLVLGYFYVFIYNQDSQYLNEKTNFEGTSENNQVDINQEFDNILDLTEDTEDVEITADEGTKIPSTFDNDVTFFSQAPTGSWELPYQEACEESSLILVSYFFQDKYLDSEVMDAEIQRAVAWQEENFGTYSDTSVNEVMQMASEHFGLQGTVIEDVTEDILKSELTKGNVIVAPFAGRLLGNKYYSGDGPLYHMLVIRGYDRNEFITNDVGTQHGESFKYKYSTLINAIHDLPLESDGTVYRPYEELDSEETKEELMLTGKKLIISFSSSVR